VGYPAGFLKFTATLYCSRVKPRLDSDMCLISFIDIHDDSFKNTEIVDTKGYARLSRRIERADDVVRIGRVLGLVGDDLRGTIDSLPDADFDELAIEARVVSAAGTVC